MDFAPFLQLTTAVAQHQSLIVSASGMQAWDVLLKNQDWLESQAVTQCIGPILGLAMSRAAQYNHFPEDSEEASVLFVNDFIELFPERQGFYLNYLKTCMSVIERICYAYLDQAIEHMLQETEQSLLHLSAADAGLQIVNYNPRNNTFLQADIQFNAVEAAARGIARWILDHPDADGVAINDEGKRATEKMRAWTTNMLSKYTFRDPATKQRQIKAAVELANRLFPKDTELAFVVLEHILSAFVPPEGPDSTYIDATNDLHQYATSELRRLVTQHADYFATFYEQLEGKLSDLITRKQVEPRVEPDLKSCLFLIIERANNIDLNVRKQRLWNFMEPIHTAWVSDEVQTSLASFEAFCQAQRFTEVGPYMSSIQAGRIDDWSTVALDTRGAELQQQLKTQHLLPLRQTRVFLSVSTDRLEVGSSMYQTLCELWSPMVQPILEGALRIISYSHRLHDPTQWPDLSSEQVNVARKIMRDRYWQSGITDGSMAEFHNRIRSSKTSLEGFASTVRGRVRSNLEHTYSIIHTFGRLGEVFFSIPQAPQMIAEALINTSQAVRPHHFAVMLLMMPKLIDECPPAYRNQFLTPILAALLQQMDTKCVSEWQQLDQKKQSKDEDENLSDEMRDDSVLRQMIYKAVNMVAFWLHEKRDDQLSNKKSLVNGHHAGDSVGPPQSMRDFVLSNLTVLEPLLVFCTHVLAVKDTKGKSFPHSRIGLPFLVSAVLKDTGTHPLALGTLS